MDGFLQLTLGAAFLAGFTGGAHCAAMCGPLIGISCGNRGGTGGASWLRRALAYNAGRIASYVAAGALAGALGGAGLMLRGAPLAQQGMLFAMSLSMLIFAAYIAGFAPFVHGVERAGAVAWRRIEPLGRRFLPVNTAGRAFGIGLVFGWLPCGMVYMALLAALTTGDAIHGALVMAAFGLGTLPNVLAISAWLGRVAAITKGRSARFLVAATVAAAGVWGVLHAVHPSMASTGLAWCLQVPGIGTVLGGLL